MMRWSTDVFACGFVVSDLSSKMSYNIYGVVVSNIYYILYLSSSLLGEMIQFDEQNVQLG